MVYIGMIIQIDDCLLLECSDNIGRCLYEFDENTAATERGSLVTLGVDETDIMTGSTLADATRGETYTSGGLQEGKYNINQTQTHKCSQSRSKEYVPSARHKRANHQSTSQCG